MEKNDKIQQNGSSLYTHCSAVYGGILIVKVVLDLYRPGEKILWSCQPSSTKLAIVNFWKTVKKWYKNDKNQQNGSSLCTHDTAIYASILIIKVVLEP